MTVSTTNNRVSYAGNGVTVAFSFPNLFYANSDLVVLLVTDSTGASVTQVLDTDYTVTGAGVAGGGTVTMTTAPATGKTLVIYRDPPLTQTVDLVNGDTFDVEVGVERVADRAILVMQRLKDIIDRAVRFADSDTSGASVVLPSPVANNLLGWNGTATALANKVAADLSLSTVSSFVNTLLDDTTATAFIDTLRAALAAETAPAAADELLLYDASAGTNDNITLANFFKVITALTAETAPDAADEIPLYDASAATADKVTLTVLAEAIRALSTAKRSPGAAENYSLSAAPAAGALTITLTGAGGTALSAANKAQFSFRSATAGTGTTEVVDATADLTLVLSSGSAVGATSGQPFRVWIVIFNDGGTLRLGAINCSTATAIYPLADDIIASASAEGGAGAADSAGVIYAGAAVTAKAMRVLGYMEFSLTTAGTWDEAPDKIQLWQPGMKLPGDVVQVQRTATGAVSTGTTQLPLDDTIPQNTEGDEYMTQAITPTASANLLRVVSQWCGSHSAAAPNLIAALFQDTTADALAAVMVSAAQLGPDVFPLRYQKVSGATATTTFKIRAGANAAGTTTFNGVSGGRFFGGVYNSFLEVQEIMG